MLAFQLAGLLASILPQFCEALVLATQLLLPLIRKKTPADRFAEVAQGVMRQDPGILAMKFGDRWLVKTHRRGLQGRPVLRHEHSGHAVVPLPAGVGRRLRRVPTLLRQWSSAGGESMRRLSSATQNEKK